MNNRTKEKILTFVDQKYKDPNEMVNLDDIVIHLKQNFNEFERKTEKEIFKTVKWQVDNLIQQITGTNIQKSIFKKRDFFEDLHEQYQKKRD